MKKILCIIIAVFVLFCCSSVSAESSVKVIIDDNEIEFDVEPQIINDRVMVPMRKIFEALHSSVEWIEETQMIMSVNGSKIILMQIGKNIVVTKDFADGSETRTEIDTPPQIIDGRTLVPIRAVSEALSVDISWNDDERTVVIKSEDLADEWQSDDSIDDRNALK